MPRATLLAELGRTDEALAIYDGILELRPNSEPVMLTRAQTLLDADELEQAIEQYRDALAAHPDSALSLNALGYTLADRTEEYDEARALIERALALAPDNAAIIDSMGWVLFKQGELEEARIHLERAWSMIKDPEVAAHLGETLWRLGEKEEARAILKEAYDRAPNSKPLRETLKRLLREEGRVTS
ncbi:MAG: tetratricopeptide repeat protein [Pseudomonadota bacterium]